MPEQFIRTSLTLNSELSNLGFSLWQRDAKSACAQVIQAAQCNTVCAWVFVVLTYAKGATPNPTLWHSSSLPIVTPQYLFTPCLASTLQHLVATSMIPHWQLFIVMSQTFHSYHYHGVTTDFIKWPMRRNWKPFPPLREASSIWTICWFKCCVPGYLLVVFAGRLKCSWSKNRSKHTIWLMACHGLLCLCPWDALAGSGSEQRRIGLLELALQLLDFLPWHRDPSAQVGW